SDLGIERTRTKQRGVSQSSPLSNLGRVSIQQPPRVECPVGIRKAIQVHQPRRRDDNRLADRHKIEGEHVSGNRTETLPSVPVLFGPVRSISNRIREGG